MGRLKIAAMLAAASTLTLGLGTAAAHKKKFERQTTLVFEDLPGSTGDRISGQVSVGAPPEDDFVPPEFSAQAAVDARKKCLSGHTVQIRHRLTGEGGGGSGTSVVVATTRTDANGF